MLHELKLWAGALSRAALGLARSAIGANRPRTRLASRPVRVRVAFTAVLIACVAAPVAAEAAAPIMKLSDVRAGMRCSGLSVIRGTAVSQFEVEIVDVLRGDPETSGPRILIRVSGPAVDETGIGPGFSGSPVYCPDGAGGTPVVGAISEGLGQYGNHVALATPIEEMLGLQPAVARQTRRASKLLRAAHPLATPLTISGLSNPVRQSVLAAARRTGIPLLAAPSGPAAAYPPYALDPGTAVAVGLSSGDIAIAAIGTVTYRDGDRLWAFGHPLDGAGRRSLPLLDAYVFSIIDNPLGLFDMASTYKLASAGRPIGTLTDDGNAAIAGRVGAPPTTIPLSVSARDEASGRTRRLHVDVADERELDLGSGLDLVGTLAASNAMATVLGSTPPRVTTSMCLRIVVRQRPKRLGFCKRYFSPYAPLDDLSNAFGLIDGYKFGRLDVRRVSIGLRVRAGVREAFLLRARAPRRVRPGQRIRIRLLLQRSRAGRQRLSFPYRVPRSLRPGRHLLTVRGTGSGASAPLEDIFGLIFGGGGGGGGPRPPRSVPELGARIALTAQPNGIRASFAPKRKGPVVHRSDRLLIRGKGRVPIVVRRRPGR